MWHRTTLLKSERGLPLVFQPDTRWLRQNSWVTVENYVKWYHLYIVHPDDRVTFVTFPESAELCDKFGSCYVDHVPNPRVVRAWAQSRGYEVDENSLDMVWGRWEREARNNDEGDE